MHVRPQGAITPSDEMLQKGLPSTDLKPLFLYTSSSPPSLALRVSHWQPESEPEERGEGKGWRQGSFAGCSHPQASKRPLHCQPEVPFPSTPPTYVSNAAAIYEAFDIFACVISISLTQVRGFPGASEGKEAACNAGDLGSIPSLGRSPEEGNGNPLQYSGLENSMDRGVWQLQSLGLQSAGHS